MDKNTLLFSAMTLFIAGIGAQHHNTAIAQLHESCLIESEGTDCVKYPYETCQMTQIAKDSIVLE